MHDLFQELEDLNKNLKEQLEKEKASKLYKVIPYNEKLDFNDKLIMMSDSGYLRVLINELEAKIIKLSKVSINDFVCFFNLFCDTITICYEGDFVTLCMVSSDGTEHIMARGPLGDISLFVKTQDGLSINKILLDFATDDLINFVKFYVNFKNTFVSAPYSVFDAAQLYKGLNHSETFILH